MRFFFVSEFGETIDLASYLLHVEGHHVLIHITDDAYRKIGEGIVPHVNDWFNYLGKDYVWCFDSCSFGAWQDWMRMQGEHVVGGCEQGDILENDRQMNQRWFKQLGFDQAHSQNFRSIDEALAFVEENSDTRWVLKQNGSAPKSLNHVGKFDDSCDMIFHLKELKKHWNVAEFGEFDCDIMECVEGLEVAASAFFNGSDWLRDSRGKVVGFLNFEHKRESDGDLGATTGEVGTVFVGADEDDELFSSIILRPGISDYLKEIGFHGVFDINTIRREDGRMVALEPTCRFGVPASSYEFIDGLEIGTGELLSALAKGINRRVDVYRGVGMVLVVAAKPFPLEADVDDEATSMGERLWILADGKPIAEFTPEQRQRIHLYNFEKREDEETGEVSYRVPTKSGYLLTVTAKGEYVSTTRDELLHFIRQNIFIPDMKYRQDVGRRVEAVEMELESA